MTTRREALERLQRAASQRELFLDSRFFVLLSSLVTSHQLAVIKPTGLAVLCVLRTFANHRTGDSSVSITAMQGYTGLSRNTVIKALRVLEEHGLVSRSEVSGRRTVYRITDKVLVKDAEANEVGELLVPYKPQRTGQLIEEMRNFMKSGEVSEVARAQGMTFNIHVHIHNTTTNIQHAEHVNIKLSGHAEHDEHTLATLEESLPENHPMKGLFKRIKV